MSARGLYFLLSYRCFTPVTNKPLHVFIKAPLHCMRYEAPATL